MTAIDTIFNTSVQDETKRDKFVRLARKRLENALKDIHLIGNLLENTYAYDYTPRDVDAIVESLTKATGKIGTFRYDTRYITKAN